MTSVFLTQLHACVNLSPTTMILSGHLSTLYGHLCSFRCTYELSTHSMLQYRRQLTFSCKNGYATKYPRPCTLFSDQMYDICQGKQSWPWRATAIFNLIYTISKNIVVGLFIKPRWPTLREMLISPMKSMKAGKPLSHLTHWGRDKMDAISQTTFSSAFSWMKMFEFQLKFHWSLFLKVQLKYSSIGLDYGLAPSRRQAIIWTNDGKFNDAYMRHSASMS